MCMIQTDAIYGWPHIDHKTDPNVSLLTTAAPGVDLKVTAKPIFSFS